MEERVYTAAADDAGRRLDRVARRLFPGAPLGRIFRAIRTGAIRLNGQKSSPAARVAAGDRISAPGFEPEAGRPRRPAAPGEAARRLEALLLFEGEHAIALNKPAGMPAHGPDSAADLVLAYLESRRPASLSFRPGPAHRLDRGTSGLLLFSCSLAGAQALARLFRERAVAKEYLAVVEGAVAAEETWEDSIGYDHESRRSEGGGSAAVTRVVPLACRGPLTLLACFPLTGRTHQIRAQAGLRGHPLAGDRKYGGRALGAAAAGYLLHALALTVDEDAAWLGFGRLVAPPPESFEGPLGRLLGPEALAAARARLNAL